MSIVKIVRAADIVPSFQNGLSQTPVLVNEYSDCEFQYCTLKAGADWTPELFQFEDKCQIFLFIQGTGYIGGEKRAWNIRETSVFVPNFDKEKFFIHAGTDLVFVRMLGHMSDYDIRDIRQSSMTLPRFRGLSECWTYEEEFKGPGTTSAMLLEHRNLGRFSMGATLGKGPAYNGDHVHNELEQWYIALPGSSFTYTAGDEKVDVHGGDITYTTHGFHHGSIAKEGETLDYVWFEICHDGYPSSIS